MQEKATAKYHVLARGVIRSDHHLLVAHCKGMDHTFLRKLMHNYISRNEGPYFESTLEEA
ncbi:MULTISPECIES: hypothetical protein [Paenibacillus]|uniref:hypothetical protein n=1 Tax=Paenibacillus TaxID=44249 RepID=UPI00073E7687|nr:MULTISPECIES: hypothetical protein [Paenibacillus]MDU4696502.1 hypothetical protein [Paenibacillus sp.]